MTSKRREGSRLFSKLVNEGERGVKNLLNSVNVVYGGPQRKSYVRPTLGSINKIWHLHFQLQTAPLPTTPDTYTDREIIAYNIEYAVKFAYPVAFVCFNIIYWVIYMEKFNEEIMNDWNKIYLLQKIPKKKLFLNPLNDFYVKTTELIVD